MAGLSKLLKSHLRSLGRFSGREARTQFWPYVGYVIGGWLITGWILAAAIFVGLMKHPQQFIFVFLGQTMLSALLVVTLLAGAVARRLHDAGINGAFGLLPVPFLAVGLGGFSLLMFEFASGPSSMIFFVGICINNIIYFVMLAILVVLLVRRGTPGPNRYGDPPPTSP